MKCECGKRISGLESNMGMCYACVSKESKESIIHQERLRIADELEGLKYPEKSCDTTDAIYFRKIHNRDLNAFIQKLREK